MGPLSANAALPTGTMTHSCPAEGASERTALPCRTPASGGGGARIAPMPTPNRLCRSGRSNEGGALWRHWLTLVDTGRRPSMRVQVEDVATQLASKNEALLNPDRVADDRRPRRKAHAPVVILACAGSANHLEPITVFIPLGYVDHHTAIEVVRRRGPAARPRRFGRPANIAAGTSGLLGCKHTPQDPKRIEILADHRTPATNMRRRRLPCPTILAKDCTLAARCFTTSTKSPKTHKRQRPNAARAKPAKAPPSRLQLRHNCTVGFAESRLSSRQAREIEQGWGHPRPSPVHVT